MKDSNGVDVNPRYVLWAKKHGRTPEEQLEADKQEYPGACMCGYILWINEQGSAFAKKVGEPRAIAIVAHQDEFTEYLAESVDNEQAKESQDGNKVN